MRDDDKQHDKFNPGVTNDQIRRAEEMLGGLDIPTFVEKRNHGDYRGGVLRRTDGTDEAVDVRISTEPVEGDDRRYVVLSRERLPAMSHAEISIRVVGQVRTMTGWLEEGHRGRRNEDRLDGDTLMVSFFHRQD